MGTTIVLQWYFLCYNISVSPNLQLMEFPSQKLCLHLGLYCRDTVAHFKYLSHCLSLPSNTSPSFFLCVFLCYIYCTYLLCTVLIYVHLFLLVDLSYVCCNLPPAVFLCVFFEIWVYICLQFLLELKRSNFAMFIVVSSK